ncbi:MAG: hypothetical protein ACREYF_20495 [Gammaproteobacteria bacterium]
MFLSADEGLVFKLAEAGKTVDRGVIYALGRIVIMVPHGSPLKAQNRQRLRPSQILSTQRRSITSRPVAATPQSWT